jgi:hypothetical protein
VSALGSCGLGDTVPVRSGSVAPGPADSSAPCYRNHKGRGPGHAAENLQ